MHQVYVQIMKTTLNRVNILCPVKKSHYVARSLIFHIDQRQVPTHVTATTRLGRLANCGECVAPVVPASTPRLRGRIYAAIHIRQMAILLTRRVHTGCPFAVIELKSLTNLIVSCGLLNGELLWKLIKLLYRQSTI